ncbi:MAG: tetratricopeptide repeat protein [Bryobacteraceae bacterium]|nr:tetratricopeptide repeat protein [Bryobacteraceae bacterium]
MLLPLTCRFTRQHGILVLGCCTASLFAQSAPQQSPAITASSRGDQGLARPATAVDPSKAITPEMRGDILMARKNYREAIEVYRGIPGSSAVIVNKTGIGYHQMLDLDTAKKYYERAVKLNPKYAEALNNLGTVHYGQKRYRRAISTYNKALEIAPNSASILSNLGTAHFARKKYKEAMECYTKAMEIDPDIFEHRNTHGVMLQERSVTERATFHYHLAKLYAKNGNTERALMYVRKAIEEGFKDRQKFLTDSEFAQVKDLPEFQEILKIEAKVL